MEHATRAVEAAEALGSGFSRAQAYGALGAAHRLNAHWDEAAAALEQSRAITREIHTGISDDAYKMIGLAEIYLHQGRPAEARSMAEEAVALAHSYHASIAECYACIIQARILLATDGQQAADRVIQILARALALVEETGGASFEPMVRLELAQLAHLSGDETGRQRELREAHRQLLAIGAPLRAAQVARELAT